MSELEIVLTELRSYRESHQKDMSAVYKQINSTKKCQTQMKLDALQNQNDTKKNTDNIKNHMDDDETHFNPYHNEQIHQKIWRKKGEYTIIGGSIGTIIIGVIKILIDTGIIGG